MGRLPLNRKPSGQMFMIDRTFVITRERDGRVNKDVVN
jgi:hypothetical protein